MIDNYYTPDQCVNNGHCFDVFVDVFIYKIIMIGNTKLMNVEFLKTMLHSFGAKSNMLLHHGTQLKICCGFKRRHLLK